jgi:hypothetical protein
MSSDENKWKIKSLAKFGLVVKKYNLALEEQHESPPFIRFSHTSYPGFEAHLFTIADSSLWNPVIISDSDVVLSGYEKSVDPHEQWSNLFTVMNELMRSLEQYRQGLKLGIIPSTTWAYYETSWYRENWEKRSYEMIPAEDFLYLVDESIRPHIKQLNELGFSTTQSCSGLPLDHTDREPYLPYVMFDERTYPRISAHLFTLADMSGWIPSYGPHNFDIEFRLNSPRDAERLWDRLVGNAHKLAKLLAGYKEQFVR